MASFCSFRVWMGVLGVCGIIGCAPQSPKEPTSNPALAEVEASPSPLAGDEACVDCHAEIYASYHRTGMGRSVSRFDPDTAPERFGPDVVVYDRARDYYYAPLVRGDTLFQREYRLDSTGAVTYEQIHAVAWVIGSGNATRSYIMDVNGYLTEMPLTWYVDRRAWDLSPGYSQRNRRFSRAITPECMTCHNGIPTHSTFTLDHYTYVPDGITCERCHGPAADHVEARLSGFDPPPGAPDPDVVNPARLGRTEQLGVCQQCHLSGITVVRPGETLASFRPGQPLAAHRSVFAVQEELTDPERFGIASHAERLARSACYRESEMTCTTCHDPHRPVAELEPDHFNRVCVGCHDPREVEGTYHPAGAASDDCTSCHLQQSGTTDIPHVTFTDHWIRKTVPASRRPDEIEREIVQTAPVTLVPAEPGMQDRTEGEKMLEEAVAYFHLYDTRHRLPAYLPQIVDRARAGLATGADHPEARLALGRALAEMDSLREAEQALDDAAARYPDHAMLQYWLGRIRLSEGRPADAVEPLRAAVTIQPAFREARVAWGEALAGAGRSDEAEAAYRAALDQDPEHLPEAWNDLGVLYLEQSRLAEARDAFEHAVARDPDFATALVNLASVLLVEGDEQAAVPLLEHAVDKDPRNVAGLGNLGVAYARLGRYEEAEARLRDVVRLSPSDTRARAILEEVMRHLRASD